MFPTASSVVEAIAACEKRMHPRDVLQTGGCSSETRIGLRAAQARVEVNRELESSLDTVSGVKRLVLGCERRDGVQIVCLAFALSRMTRMSRLGLLV